jgi:hypothetical protein
VKRGAWCDARGVRRGAATGGRPYERITESFGRHIGLLVFILVGFVQFATPAHAQTAADTWGWVPKYIAIHPGTTASVWSDASRSQITNGRVAMTPVGDGTYEYVVGLTRGQSYNYIFWANSDSTPKGGLKTWNEYYDIMPTSGKIRVSTDTVTKVWNDTTSAYYAPVNYDARRVLSIPATKDPGDTMYVFNNFGETPGLVANFQAWNSGETQILLTWDAPYGNWGSWGEPVKAADVLAGGSYEIYRSAVSESGPFTLVATVQGHLASHTDTDLAPGNTYYYAIRALDAYGGSGLTDSFTRLRGETSTVDSAVTTAAIRAFFLVQGGSWPVIERQEGKAWFSRPEDPPWGDKMPVRVVRVVAGLGPRREM